MELMSHKYSALAVLMMISFLAACSSGGGNQSQGTARVGLTIHVPAAVEKISTLNREKSSAPAPAPIAAIGVSVVDAEGRLLTSTRVAVSPGQEVTITLEVAAGRARTFTVQAIDETGTVLFQGQASADLTAGVPTSLPIRMEPINLIPTLSISPTTLSILLGKSQLFTATLTGSADPALIWSVNGIPDGNSALGTITPSSATTATYTAPATLPDLNQVTIKVSSASNPELTATAIVTLLTSPIIDNTAPFIAIISPVQNESFGCGPVPLVATASDPENLSMVVQVDFFYLNNATEVRVPGNVTVSGNRYTASWTPPSSGNFKTFTIRAKAIDGAGNIGQSADVSFDYSCIINITITPTSVAVRKGEKQAFTVSPTATVDWRVESNIGGNGVFGFIDSNGIYTAPAQIPVQGNTPVGVTVDAVLTSNGAASNAASVRVITGPTLKFSPNEAVTKELSIKPPTSTDSSGQRNIAFYNGQILVTWSANQPRTGWDVLFAESSDGKNWKMTTVAGGVDNQAIEPQPAIAVGADGTVYILYRAEKSSSGCSATCPKTIELATRRPGDLTFSTQVLEQRGKDGQATQDPTIVVSPEGVVFAAWSANLSDTGLDIYFQRIGKDGKPIDATPQNLTGIVGGSNELQPVLSTNDGKEVFLAWQQQVANAQEIIVLASRDGGDNFSSPSAPINDKGPGKNPSIAAGLEGRVYLSWETDECPNLNCLSIYFSAGTLGDKLIFDTSTRLPQAVKAIDQMEPSIAWNQSDGIYIAFNEFVSGFGNRIFLAKSIDEGKSFSISDISQETATTGSVKSAPSVALDAAGRVFAVWTDARNASPGNADVFFSMGE